MLKIDNQIFKITKQHITVSNFIDNGIKGYNINVNLEFNNNNKSGYLFLSAGFEKTNDINNFINKEYIGKLYDERNSQINYFEIYDTTKFLDTEIESKITLKLKSIIANKIEANIEIKDKLINIKYEGHLDIII